MAASNNFLNTTEAQTLFIASLLAGGYAGICVDVTLFPLDTLKTRLQSAQGFIKSGGFSHLYKGILPAIAASGPSASLFFVTYEGIKSVTECRVPERYHSLLHMGSASLAEMAACLIRVPLEIMKQREQALIFETRNINIRLFSSCYWSTVLRDMPFSLIQFPLWEYFKKIWSSTTKRDILPIESATCGAIAGGISAAITTPLDVAKTRIMLSDANENPSKLKIPYVLKSVYRKNGIFGLFAGVSPRAIWMTLGGFIFFGTYESGRTFVINRFPYKDGKI